MKTNIMRCNLFYNFNSVCKRWKCTIFWYGRRFII